MTAEPSPFRLFEPRRKIYPVTVTGRYRRLKWAAMAVLLSVYYGAPFLRYDRGPHVPHQAILIDMPERRAYFFGIEIWPQEVYYLVGLLILAAVGLFFVTSLLGRVWCGYACPQTVWTDLFLWVERVFQGDKNAQIKLDRAPWGISKIFRKGATHAAWILIAFFTGGAWTLYFHDAPTLVEDLFHLSVSPMTAGWIGALTFSTYLMAGFAREQVCTYMCPYARFQSAMFDRDTLIIGYDTARGEPRAHHKKGTSWEGRGHCIDCTRCVQVCPVGIDIRKGLQMECIACGLCVDACNDVMDKIDLPRGLIRYDTARRMEEGQAAPTFVFWRARTFYYLVVLALVEGVMGAGLFLRSSFELSVLHDRNPLFVRLSDGKIRNGYVIKISNKTHEDQIYRLSVSGVDDAFVSIHDAGDKAIETIPVFAGSVGEYRLFITAPEQKMPRLSLVMTLQDVQGKTDTVKSVFMSNR